MHPSYSLNIRHNTLAKKQKTTLPSPMLQTIRLDCILTDEDTFQPRGGGMNESHVAALVDALNRGQTLDPIAVWKNPETGQLTVTDGHHRLEAFRRTKTGKVQAWVYCCGRELAPLIAIRDNAKTKLPLTYDDKANYAWKLTMEEKLSKEVIVDHCGVSDGTVGNMRRVWKSLRAQGGEDVPKTWRAAQKQLRGGDPREWSEEDYKIWEAEELERADRQIGASLSALIKRSPEVGGLLVERCAGRQLEPMLGYIGFGPFDKIDDDEF